MPKLRIGLRDSLFAHANSASRGDLGEYPQYIEFDREDKACQITIFTDKNLDDVYISNSKVKIAWLIEPPALHPQYYKQLSDPNFYAHFDMIMTYDYSLLKLGPKFTFLPLAGCWIENKDWSIYKKTNNISIIASSKKELAGHRLRHEVIKKLGDKIDVFGNGYQAIDSKLIGLASYRYSIVIENVKQNYWFTEKLIDCFATGTVPIYWGCPDIAKVFESKGIITFSSAKELATIIESLSGEDYENRMLAINKNFELFKQYSTIEDYMYLNIIKNRLQHWSAL